MANSTSAYPEVIKRQGPGKGVNGGGGAIRSPKSSNSILPPNAMRTLRSIFLSYARSEASKRDENENNDLMVEFATGSAMSSVTSIVGL